MSREKQSWSNEDDFVASWDQVSVFSKGQSKVAKVKIPSERREKIMRYKEAKRLEAELLQRDIERQEREMEKLKEDRLLEEALMEREQAASSRNSPFRPTGRGRARLMNDMRKKIEGTSLLGVEYITEQVRMNGNYYGNDLIEKNWPNADESTSKECSSSSEERSSPAVTDGQFDDASSTTSTSDCPNTYDKDKEFPVFPIQTTRQRIPPRNRNAIMNALEKKLDLSNTESMEVSMNSPTTVVEEPRFVLASSEKPICASKYTFPSLYNADTSFRNQWSSKYRKLTPMVKRDEFCKDREFHLDNEDFPPL